MRRKLTYLDYRPIKEGDEGYTPEKKKARWYYSPSRKYSIPYRTFVTEAGGGITYEKYAAQQRKKGVAKKQYKPRTKPTTPRKPKVLTKDEIRKQYIDRVLFLKKRYAKKVAGGYEMDWDAMPDSEKTLFWQKYHELMDQYSYPTEDEYDENYADYFDMDYEEVYDLTYGETP